MWQQMMQLMASVTSITQTMQVMQQQQQRHLTGITGGTGTTFGFTPTEAMSKAGATYIDYTQTEGATIYHKMSAPISKGVTLSNEDWIAFSAKIAQRAKQMDMNLLFPKDKANFGNLACTDNYHVLEHYASYSMEHLQDYVKTYIFAQGLEAQKDYTMGVAIMHYLSELTLTKMAKEKSRYTMTNPTTKVEVESGLLMIKAYLKLASLDTGGIALIAEQQIIKMPDKFESAYGNDPITFLDQLQVHLNTLEYNGDPMKETQVVTVIFNAMNQVKQECFKTWIDKRYDEFALEPKQASSRDLMLKI
jgi:hypothetical protein